MIKKKSTYITAGIIVYVGAIFLISHFEQSAENANIHSATDALWYAIVTLTTVGYGDFYPVTPAGKVTGLFMIIGSIGILGAVIGEITTKYNQFMEKKKNGFWGVDFTGHYIIIGWSDFGRQVAQQIFNTGHKIAFVVNNKNELDLVKDVFPQDNCFGMFADYQNMEAYTKVKIDDSKGVFINFKEDTETLVYAINLKKSFPKADIVVACSNSSLKETFKNAGIHHVISKDEVASKLVASYIFEPHVASLTDDLLATSYQDSDFDINQYRITYENSYCGKPFLQTFFEVKEKYDSAVIGLVVDGKLIKKPKNDYTIKAGDYLILIADGQTKKRIEADFKVAEGE